MKNLTVLTFAFLTLMRLECHAGETHPPVEKANTVIKTTYIAKARAIENGKSGIVNLPVPGLYREQFPLTFKLSVQPAGALLDYRFRKRKDGINWLCEVNVKPPNNQPATIKWESLVLVSGRETKNLPKVKLAEFQNQIAIASLPWLRSTACVQSADPGIRKKSEELGKNIVDVETYARKVIEFTSSNEGKPGVRFDALDAKKALACGGSCTSKANLAAALLRAHDIPARTVAHLPSWYDAPMFEHWLVEYWHPGVGWVWIEPTLERFQPAPNELVLLAVSSPEDEDKAFDQIQLRYIMPGAAYLSGCLLSPNLTSGSQTEHDTSENRAKQVGTIRGTNAEMSALFESGRKNFSKLMLMNQDREPSPAHSKLIEEAVKKGKASDLNAALKNQIPAKF